MDVTPGLSVPVCSAILGWGRKRAPVMRWQAIQWQAIQWQAIQ
jgi:hypothetical protein